MRITTEHAGRELVFEVDEIDREFDQFNITVSVGGKQRWSAWFSDHGPQDSVPFREEDAK